MSTPGASTFSFSAPASSTTSSANPVAAPPIDSHATTPLTPSTFSFNVGGGFNFSSTATTPSNSTATPATPTFSFGSPQATTTPPAAPATSFHNFSEPTSKAKKKNGDGRRVIRVGRRGFGFTTQPTASEPATAAFSFFFGDASVTAAAAPSPAPTFGVGLSSTTTAPVSSLSPTPLESVLKNIGPRPKITITIKGVINSGKSTLFNSILTKTISKASMRRETMCQVALSEHRDTCEDVLPFIAERISEANAKLYLETEAGDISSVTDLPCLEYSIPLVTNFLTHFEGVDYRFVETVGFDDPQTDDASHKWFSINTIYSDVLLFVTDKEKCMNNSSEQNLFRQTVLDLKQCIDRGKTVPLVVIINKVDEIDDEEVQGMIMQCKINVNRIIEEVLGCNSAYSLPLEFVSVSAMSCLMYRTFLKKKSFEGMDQKDILRLAEKELGREGKNLASDPLQHVLLAKRIEERLHEVREGINQWQKESGIEALKAALQKLLLYDGQASKVLLSQFNLHLREIEEETKSILQKDIIAKRLSQILDLWDSYKRAFDTFRLSEEEKESLELLRRKCAELYLNCHRIFLERIYSNMMPDDIDKEIIESSYQMLHNHKSQREFNLFESDAEWAKLKSNTIARGLQSKWSRFISTIPSPITMQQHAQSLNDALELTSALMEENDANFSELFQNIIIPLVENMTAEIAILEYYSDLPFIARVEKCILRALGLHSSQTNVHIAVFLLFLKKKISLREFFPGYSSSLKQLISSSTSVLQRRYFFIFYPILNHPAPKCDFIWASKLGNVPDEEFYGDEKYYEGLYTCFVENHPMLMSEKALLSGNLLDAFLLSGDDDILGAKHGEEGEEKMMEFPREEKEEGAKEEGGKLQEENEENLSKLASSSVSSSSSSSSQTTTFETEELSSDADANTFNINNVNNNVDV